MDAYADFTKIPEHIRRIKIDVGLSYNAPQSQVWLDHDNDLYVYGFEPNPESIESIKYGNITKRADFHGQPLSSENFKRFCLCPVALGNVDSVSEMEFYMMKNDCGTSSLFKPSASELGDVKQVTKVPVLSLSMLFDIFPWDRFPYIEYIKVDAQGADLDIIKGAGKYLSDRVVYVTLEPESSTYEGCGHNTVGNITAYMNSQGFERIHHPNTGDPTFLNMKFKHIADSIFIYQRG